MLNRLKKIDIFAKNIIIVFAGTSLVNFFNLVYQLLIAHRLSACDFAAFNSLLSIFMLISIPCGTLQIAVAKYCAEFNATNQLTKVKFLLSNLLKKTSIFAIATLLFFCLISTYIINVLKISSVSSGYILALMLALSWPTTIFFGGVQGLEFFGWFTFVSVVTGALKLLLALIFITLGYNISGALGALLASIFVGFVILYLPLRRFISIKGIKGDINYKEIFIYLFPIAITYFCFTALVNFDMVLVRYFFPSEDSGLYSIAQMVGKIFLFLPGAISLVMFPRVSGLKAKNMDTISTLEKSLVYALGLCIFTFLFYNFFPALVLKVLTGKVHPLSILLGRLFSISMTFFSLLFILTSYFISIKDLRFVKYLVLFFVLQFLAIVLFHKSLIHVQLILCINAILLFLIHLRLLYKNQGQSSLKTIPYSA